MLFHRQSAMLAMGSSRPWPEAMEALTGQREMKADAILEYFQPLMEWLEKTNEENGDVIGWDMTTSMKIKSFSFENRIASLRYLRNTVQ